MFFLSPNPDATIYPFGVEENDRKYKKIEYSKWWEKEIRATFPEYANRK